MFEFNALSQLSIALFIYYRHGGWPCHLRQGQSIQGWTNQGQKFDHKAKDYHPWYKAVVYVDIITFNTVLQKYHDVHIK